jgi:hypothetical protein
MISLPFCDFWHVRDVRVCKHPRPLSLIGVTILHHAVVYLLQLLHLFELVFQWRSWTGMAQGAGAPRRCGGNRPPPPYIYRIYHCT